MIFYFSGTGNTRWVARQIAETIGEELLSIPDLIRDGCQNFMLHEHERIGFCFPTHGWQPPRIVRDFIGQLRIKRAQQGHQPVYCWALTTCGDNMGEAMAILNKDLAKSRILDATGETGQPLQAEALFSVIMPESYVCLPFMYTDSDEKVERKISNARRQVEHIIQIVKNQKRGIEELEKGPTPRLYSYVIGGYFNKRMITDRKFTVDQNKCIQCGKCTKVCPVDNISGASPVWHHNGQCTCCLACYHHCPVHAINYGKITRKRGQYHFNTKEPKWQYPQYSDDKNCF